MLRGGRRFGGALQTGRGHQGDAGGQGDRPAPVRAARGVARAPPSGGAGRVGGTARPPHGAGRARGPMGPQVARNSGASQDTQLSPPPDFPSVFPCRG
ncbi:hypothetical protein E6W39_28915 [Kitasatospora acidiphila]|uniref:Uncharacterized protein n=1 Tax=Kitasatospora acidiphila TaxID=2567942 RepID=A0A540W917_9ACTN|nr:hypothetical protein E6W39_28915 [Kitasatospora acidiphila]